MRLNVAIACSLSVILLASCDDRSSPITTRSATTASPTSDVGSTWRYDDLLLDASVCATPSPERVDVAGMRIDIAVVERVLRRGYAGFDALAERGLNWARIFDGMRSGLSDMSTEQFQGHLYQHLKAAGDNHLALYRTRSDGSQDRSATGGHQDAYAVEGRATGCGDLRPFVSDPPGVQWIPIVFNKPEGVECSGQRRATRRLGVARWSSRGVPAFESIEAPVPYLRLRSLNGARHTELSTFVATANRTRSAPASIVDLRGNPGGTDGPVIDWFELLTSQQLSYGAIVRLQSEVTLQGTVNEYVCTLANLNADDSGGREIEQRLASARRALADAKAAAHDPRKLDKKALQLQGVETTAYKGRLIVLVDHRCGSACESVVRLARQLPGTIVAGENTAGSGEFGEVLRYRLPRSGLWMDVGSKRFTSHGNATMARETVGHMPDIWIDKKHPGEVAVKIAQCLSRPACAAALTQNLAAPRQ